MSVQRAGRNEPSGMLIKRCKTAGNCGWQRLYRLFGRYIIIYRFEGEWRLFPFSFGYYAPTNFLSTNVFFRNTLTVLVFRRKMGGGSCPDLFSCTDYQNGREWERSNFICMVACDSRFLNYVQLHLARMRMSRTMHFGCFLSSIWPSKPF